MAGLRAAGRNDPKLEHDRIGADVFGRNRQQQLARYVAARDSGRQVVCLVGILGALAAEYLAGSVLEVILYGPIAADIAEVVVTAADDKRKFVIAAKLHVVDCGLALLRLDRGLRTLQRHLAGVQFRVLRRARA